VGNGADPETAQHVYDTMTEQTALEPKAEREIHWKRVHPATNWVLVKVDPRRRVTSGGIHLTDTLTKAERVMEGSGEVLRVGPKVEEIEVGDRIVFRGFLKEVSSDIFAKIDDAEVCLLKEDDVLMVIGGEHEVGVYSVSSDVA
jgi:co-chaperonin GroES (HSP10)